MAEPMGLLVAGMNYTPVGADEFNAWYNEEHIPALAAVPGCLCARRFKTDDGTHRYIALYHLNAPEVQVTTAWKKAVDTPWTAKMRPHFRDPLRVVLRRYVKAN